MEWKLAEAKSKLSEVFQMALTSGPQIVRGRGEAVVLLSETEYTRLTSPRPSLIAFLRKNPEALPAIPMRQHDDFRPVDL